jgi:hypothetical protein
LPALLADPAQGFCDVPVTVSKQFQDIGAASSQACMTPTRLAGAGGTVSGPLTHLAGDA